MSTKREYERRMRQNDTLRQLGFTQHEADQLRRISMTLRRWHELECGTGDGCIERDEKTGIPYWFNANSRFLQAGDRRAYSRIPDREKGALKRLAAIIAARNVRLTGADWMRRQDEFLRSFVQTDPRGCALYILRPGDVPAGESADAYYSRGICVY